MGVLKKMEQWNKREKNGTMEHFWDTFGTEFYKSFSSK